MTVTAKFGGSSLADAEQFKKVLSILQSDPARRYVVVSAPGKRWTDEEKITDLLYRTHRLFQEGGDWQAPFSRIEERFYPLNASCACRFRWKQLSGIYKTGSVREHLPPIWPAGANI